MVTDFAEDARDGEKMTVQEAINMYNANPQVSAHGGSSSKEIRDLKRSLFLICYVLQTT